MKHTHADFELLVLTLICGEHKSTDTTRLEQLTLKVMDDPVMGETQQFDLSLNVFLY